MAIDDNAARNRVLVRTSWISTVGNAVLSAAKITVGALAGSLAVLGDGIDSATDVVISVVMIFTARIVGKPPTKKYPYGYEKAETIATKILSLIIFYAGVQMLVSSVESMFSPEPKLMPAPVAIYVTLFSIVGKLLLALYQYRQGKRVQSALLTANAVNMRNDVIISLGVLVGLVFTFALDMPVLDTVTGLVISLFIIKSSVTIFMDSNVELMDGVKDETVYARIFQAVEAVPGAHNPHRVRSRQIGNMYMIALDIEVDGTISVTEAHRIANEVERSIKARIDNIYDIVVHVEPEGVHHDGEKFGIARGMVLGVSFGVGRRPLYRGRLLFLSVWTPPEALPFRPEGAGRSLRRFGRRPHGTGGASGGTKPYGYGRVFPDL